MRTALRPAPRRRAAHHASRRTAAHRIVTRTVTALALAASTALAVSSAHAGTPPRHAASGHATASGSATAAGLQRVDGFGSNPGALTMYRYVPDGLPSGRPVVVLLHGCTQDAAGYFTGAGWKRFADAGGFSVVAAQQETANNSSRCFNWFQSGDTARGKGEALSIRQMVDRQVADLDADASRVYVTGLSAGGGMTASLLAAYPDVFKGGAVIGGLPAGCATSLPQAYTCMNPGVTKSPQQWGDLARAAHPGYDGPRPTVSVWHGTADHTVAAANARESVKQWTNVLGADQTADATASLPGDTTLPHSPSGVGGAPIAYENGSGDVVVRSYLVDGMGHGTPVKPSEGCGQAGAYFLDRICSSARISADWGLTAAD